MFTELLPRVGPALVIARLREGSGWSALLAPEAQLHDARQTLQEEAEAQGAALRVVVASPDLLATMDALCAGEPVLTLLVVAAALPEDAAQILDLHRARLPTDRPVILLMSPSAATRLFAASQHFESLVQQVENLDLDLPVLTQAEVQERLAALARWSGRTDAEVITLAERGALPPDPDYAEWVILLGRGELLVER